MSARDYAEKDYYAALGVPKDAPTADIKRAYRRLASEHHPDRNPEGAERFKEISEAWDVLSDDAKRREYDDARTLFANGGGRRMPGGAGGFDASDLFGQGGGGFSDVFGGLFGGRRQPPRRGADLETSVTLSFVDAVRGATVPLRLSTTGACSTCRGSGAAPGTTPETCPLCRGQGVVSRNQGSFSFAEPCTRCRGTGSVVQTPCPTCHGHGPGEARADADRPDPGRGRDGPEDPAQGQGGTGRARRTGG